MKFIDYLLEQWGDDPPWDAWRLARLAEQRLGALVQDPGSSDVLVAAPGHVAAVGMGKARRRDHQPPLFGRDLAALIQELGLAAIFHVVEVEHPQQHAVQRIAAGVLRIDLGMPVVVAAAILPVLLQVDGAGAVQHAHQVFDIRAAHFLEVVHR